MHLRFVLDCNYCIICMLLMCCLCSEPEFVELSINGKTDKCSSGEDINFQFTGFGIVGKV